MANIPTRLNNPGDLKDPSTGTFRVFKSPQEGFSALEGDIGSKIKGETSTGLTGDSTLEDFANVWAPASDKNNPTSYAKNLASKLGVDSKTPLKNLTGRVHDFASAIADNEGYQGPRVLADESEKTMETIQPDQHQAMNPYSGFAAKIKAKYPQYKDIPDEELTQKILAKYPQYKDMATGGGSTGERKTFSESLSPATQQNSGEQTSGYDWLDDAKKGNYGDAAYDAVLGLGGEAAKVVPGVGQLAEGAGSNLAYLQNKAKAAMGGTDNSRYIPAGNLKDSASGAVKVGGTAAAIAGGGGLLQSALGLGAESGALATPEVSEALSKFGSGGAEDIANMSTAEKFNALSQAAKEAEPAQQRIIQAALKQLAPMLDEESGIAEAKPGILKQILSKGISAAKYYALTKGLGDTVGGIIHGVTGK